MATTERLSKWVVETQFPELPENAVKEVKKSILDGIGTSLESTIRPIGRIVAEFTEEIGGTPTSRLIGSGLKTSAPNAAFANGILTHGSDYDDGGAGFGHTASVLMPTVMALGEQHHLSGKQLLEGFIVGFEVGSKIGQNIGGDHYERGWHSTATNGTLGATAAASRLLGLDVDQTRSALGLATSSASGVRANFGFMGKPYHPGNAARAGIVSAMLAKKGFTANPDAIEDRFGYFSVFADEHSNIDAVARNLGNPLAITGGIHIKPWPCCGGTHAALTCLEEMKAEHTELKADDIAWVDVSLSQEPLNIAPSIWDPQTGINGKFSLWYVIAAYLLDGEINLNSFTDRKVQRSKAQDLMKRVKVEQHNDFKAKPARASESARFNEITIHLKDGTEFKHRAENGRSLEGEDILNKFRDNARLAGMGKSQIERIIQTVNDLEKVEDVTALMDASVAQVNAGID
ncbi:MAG: MmgE/PrpD family protein [Chloroflexi bacterium]|nr:MmgE/PrpD family protein [Chloroflexota bacterium]